MALENESPRARGSWAFLGASIDVGTIRELDRFRGEIPRSRVVEQALKQFLERESSGYTQGERQNNNR
jgi:hypothetical protein